jgi:flagellar biosynthesis chaperone FliJ
MENTPVLGNFQINLPAPNGASLSVNGYVYEGESLESLVDRMNMMRGALESQQRALELPVLEERIAQLDRTLEQVMSAYADLLEKQKQKQLATTEKPHLRNYPLQIKQLKEEIEKGRSKIAEFRKAA